jgi:hypothetical protein
LALLPSSLRISSAVDKTAAKYEQPQLLMHMCNRRRAVFLPERHLFTAVVGDNIILH